MTSYIGSLVRPRDRQSAALSRLLGRLTAKVLNWRRRRRDYAVLMGQPDYMLRDIGLARQDIEGAVRGRIRIS
jgi:uncharacterized protein YjiS (DUF1127 family)